MIEAVVGEELSIGLTNAVLLALWAVLPVLLLGYTQQSLAARRVRPEFSLRKSEVAELDRAVLLYEKACARLKEINDQGDGPNAFWWGLIGRRADTPNQADELQDLEAYAHHLRATIIRLRRRPLQRLRSWGHIVSSKFALGGALAAHAVGLVLLIVAFHFLQTDASTTSESSLLVWYPLDAHIFYANSVAAGLAAVVAPTFYFMRQASLRQERALEFCAFKELADVDPGQVLDQMQDGPDPSQPADLSAASEDSSWFAVLGLSHSATVEEVKQAYKALIKQNHPDRVHGLAPAFRKLAEAETKKLNDAYRRALFSIPSFEAAWSARPSGEPVNSVL
jgi:hypothetical protein